MRRFWGCSNVALQFIYATCKLNFGSWFPFVEFGIPDLEFRPLQSRLHLRLVSAFVRRGFAMQVPALSIAWMEQNLNSKKISKGLKRTIGTIQAQAQESWWTSCKKPAHALDSQKSQDFLELSGKLLTKLHFFFLGILGLCRFYALYAWGILGVCSAGFVSLLNASVEFMHKPKISKNPVG